MTLPRTIRKQRPVAWLALIAILLLAIVPTISQVIAAHAPHSGTESTSQHHGAPGTSQHDHAARLGALCPGGDRHGDDWHKCGYCDFLAHSPAVGHVAYSPQFSVALPLAGVSDVASPRARSAYSLAAQPRGPPSFFA